MRLLHTTTVTLSEFRDDEIPPYAILSHTWGKAEVSLQHLDKCGAAQLERDGLAGYLKIKACCAIAAEEGYHYVWIDTCCIDKTSSAELSEAINSMYRWYQNADVCYAYLVDVCIGDQGLLEREFGNSSWFTRGWTLQELLAPKKVVFYDKDWRKFGSKSSLMFQISAATRIHYDHLLDINAASAAQKMSWASSRKTTRVEDLAYSLMGIFNVNMPLLYGEGDKAFTRLQHEIVKMSDDESIFAWTDPDLVTSGIFARSPKAFAGSVHIVQITERHRLHVRRAPYAITNRGLAIQVFDNKDGESPYISKWGISLLSLNCGLLPESFVASVHQVQQLIAIDLDQRSRDEFFRSSPGQLNLTMWPADVSRTRLIYIRPIYTLCDIYHPQHLFFIKASPMVNRGFWVPDSYCCQPERAILEDENCWKVTFGRDQSFAALLFKNTQQMLGLILRAHKTSGSIDLIALSTAQTFQEAMEYRRMIKFPRDVANPISRELKNNRRVSVILRTRRVLRNEWQHVVEFA